MTTFDESVDMAKGCSSITFGDELRELVWIYLAAGWDKKDIIAVLDYVRENIAVLVREEEIGRK
jgi:hypothetical protein